MVSITAGMPASIAASHMRREVASDDGQGYSRHNEHSTGTTSLQPNSRGARRRRTTLLRAFIATPDRWTSCCRCPTACTGRRLGIGSSPHQAAPETPTSSRPLSMHP